MGGLVFIREVIRRFAHGFPRAQYAQVSVAGDGAPHSPCLGYYRQQAHLLFSDETRSHQLPTEGN
jgi:hypothetical protein